MRRRLVLLRLLLLPIIAALGAHALRPTPKSWPRSSLPPPPRKKYTEIDGEPLPEGWEPPAYFTAPKFIGFRQLVMDHDRQDQQDQQDQQKPMWADANVEGPRAQQAPKPTPHSRVKQMWHTLEGNYGLMVTATDPAGVAAEYKFMTSEDITLPLIELPVVLSAPFASALPNSHWNRRALTRSFTVDSGESSSFD